MGSSIDIPRIGIVPISPDPAVVEALETLLAQAKSGELRGIAYIGYCTDSNIMYGYTGKEMAGNYLRTYGLLHWLADKAMERWKDSKPT